MAKRKHEAVNGTNGVAESMATKKPKSNGSSATSITETTTIQIVAGSYDRVLHGITVTIPPKGKAKFADSFLFTAHTAAIRCLALSPPSAPQPGTTQKVVLATGGRDERINLYHLSAHPPSTHRSQDDELLSSLAPRPVLENARNRELGTLLHHSSTVTRLAFPTRTKLLSSSEDSTIAVTRTRDWSLLSTIKVPKPKVAGRPSGDTAPAGGIPAGVNDFAIHPSMKTMISVSKGERSMRLWNLVTGKKAGVLNFDKGVMRQISDIKHSTTTNEAQKVAWGSSRGTDCEYAVGFDRDILVFGMDSVVRCRVMPDSKTRIHELQYLRLGGDSDESVLVVASEDGTISFFSTAVDDLITPANDAQTGTLSQARLIGKIGGKDDGVSGRIKDFKIVKAADDSAIWYTLAGGSDGSIWLWQIDSHQLFATNSTETKSGEVSFSVLLGSYQTQNRITCLDAFIMIPRPEGVEESEFEFGSSEADSDSDDE